MGAHAEEGRPFDDQELDQLQSDVCEILVENLFDAAFRAARASMTISRDEQFRGSQEFCDSSGIPFRLNFSYDGHRLVLELEYDEDEDAARVAQPPHESA